MDTRTQVTVPAAIIALMIGASLYALAVLPADALVPTHFNFSGRPDAFARPLIAFAILPAVAIALTPILLLFVRKAGGAIARSPAAFQIALGAPLAVLALTHGLLVAYTLGVGINVTRVLTFAIGLMFVVSGNIFAKVRWNRWVGIKTPWTLRDEWVWDRTQRFGGWVFVGAGTALALCALVIPAGPVLAAIEFATIAIVVAVPTAKSYLLWRERQRT
jgi:uncharacterized membrane protein